MIELHRIAVGVIPLVARNEAFKLFSLRHAGIFDCFFDRLDGREVCAQAELGVDGVLTDQDRITLSLKRVVEQEAVKPSLLNVPLEVAVAVGLSFTLVVFNDAKLVFGYIVKIV